MVEMRSPSPSDLCWNLKFTPEQEWIEPILHIAVGNIWQRAHRVARSQLDDETLAPEIIEVAVERTIRSLQADVHRDPEEVALFLERSFLQEVKRRRKANNRLIFVGSSQELPSASTQNPHALVDSAIDLEVILHDIPPEVRIALLLRYSRSRWSEVAAVLGTTEAAVRLRCKRALDRIHRKLEGENHET
jgi:DNA-directed RNA polymerase specialized sigma24 family protein